MATNQLLHLPFRHVGHVNSWLTSPIFNLGQARAQEAETAINRAKTLQLHKNPNKVEIVEIHTLLLNELSETDPFWPRWLYFAEQNGVNV